MGYYSGKIMRMVALSEIPIPSDYILRYDFNGNVLDKSTNALNGIKTGTTSFVEGRKPGTQCLSFVQGCVKTNAVLPINSDKITISFWAKYTTASNSRILMELGSSFSDKSFDIITYPASERMTVRHMDEIYGNYAILLNDFNETLWNHFVMLLDRGKAADEIIGYVNGINSTIKSQSANNTSNYINNILYIGQRYSSSLPFIGSLQDIRIYNRILTEEEIKALYQE